jgi:DMATS type aromatic prenyltransferase
MHWEEMSVDLEHKLEGHPVTLGSFAEERLRGLCRGSHLQGVEETALRVCRVMTASWRDWPLTLDPAWPSDITDDGTPIEMSLAFERGGVELRFLVEAMARPANAVSNWQAGLELNRQLAANFDADLARFEQVEDLFRPEAGQQARFALWHATGIRPSGEVAFRLYVNPSIRGPEMAGALVQQALARIDMSRAWPTVQHFLGPNSVYRPLFFSLDFSSAPQARAKVYIEHSGASAEQVEALFTDPEERRKVRQWLSTMTRSPGPYAARPILTCLAFSQSSDVVRKTVHIPVRCYTPNDAETVSRLASFLPPDQVEALTSGLSAMIKRPLVLGRSGITYSSFRSEGDQVRVTTYLAPEFFAISAPRPR